MPDVKIITPLDEALQRKVTLTKDSLKSSRVPSGSAFAFWMSNESSHLEGASLARRDASRSPSPKTPKTDPAQVEDVDSCNDGRFTALAWFRRGVNTRIDR
jgi:hypothetical protein